MPARLHVDIHTHIRWRALEDAGKHSSAAVEVVTVNEVIGIGFRAAPPCALMRNGVIKHEPLSGVFSPFYRSLNTKDEGT